MPFPGTPIENFVGKGSSGSTPGRCPIESPLPAKRRLPIPRPHRPKRDRWLRRLYFLPAQLLRLLGVRFLRVIVPQRIGHLTIEPDCYLKDRALERRREWPVLLLLPEDAANDRLVDLWRKYISVVQNRFWVDLLTPFTFFPFLVSDLMQVTGALEGTATSYATYARWGRRSPLLKLSDADRAAGRAQLARWGMPADAWFVCIHSREGGYSPEDEHWHTYRNSPVTDYLPAMEAIIAAGGWCIRLGDATMEPLPPLPGVIDYARSTDKSELLDLFFCAECRFFLGNTSGLYLVASAFGRPCALANMVPISISYGIGIDDIAIPKRLKRDRALVPISTLMRTPAAHYRYTELYEKDRLEPVSNTPEEIRLLVEEMIERLEGRAAYTAEDEARQAAYRAMFLEGVHYSYGGASRIGRAFLRDLDDPIFRSA